jgi:hypothetical protein
MAPISCLDVGDHHGPPEDRPYSGERKQWPRVRQTGTPSHKEAALDLMMNTFTVIGEITMVDHP